MLYGLTLQHALRPFPDSQAFSIDAGAVMFLQIADRVERAAGEVFDRGFRAGTGWRYCSRPAPSS
jgi:hypothetical protein